MEATNKLKAKVNAYIKEEIEKKRFVILVDDEIPMFPEDLELVNIDVSYETDKDGTNEYMTYISTFQLGGKKVFIDVFDQDTSFSDDVYLNGSYEIIWNDYEGSSIKENFFYIGQEEEGYGVPKILNMIGFHHFFNDDQELLEKYRIEYFKKAGEVLFKDAQKVFPGLTGVVVTGYTHSYLFFETGAKISVETQNIHLAIEEIEKKKNDKKELV